MKLIPIDQYTIVHACQIQHLLFPQENCFADRDYENGYLYPERGQEYWLLEVDGAWVGTAGIYHLKVEPETAWLGWFGILPEYRRRGYATEAIRLFEDVARSRGYLYARLFTERTDAAAIACYLHKRSLDVHHVEVALSRPGMPALERPGHLPLVPVLQAGRKTIRITKS